MSEVKFADCNLLEIAFNGNCQKFISTMPVQRAILGIWRNSLTFTEKTIIETLKL